jgi:serine/threonine protein kinase
MVTSTVGLDKLHSEGIPHGNVSPKSVLVNDDGWACLHAFMADGMEGRGRYQASDSGKKTLPDDIFALGIVFWELFTGRRAFECDLREARGRIHRGEMPSLSGFPFTLRRVIRNCWAREPAKRWTARMILEEFQMHHFEILEGADAAKVREVHDIVSALPISVH